MTEHIDQADNNFADEVNEPAPRWLLLLGAALLIAMMVVAAFALGVYFSERNLL